MDKEKVDKIIQYALAVAAGEDDYRSRELGPIHLLKYFYIADLAFAKRSGGQTYTGTNWQFYKFGPWAQEVSSRIEPACLFIKAEKRTFQYKTVYLTKPMLHAAPNEQLDFSTMSPSMQPEIKTEKEPMSIKAQKRRTAELNEARTRIQEKLAQKKASACARYYIRQPRYDEVYFAGQEWLDNLAGPQIPMVVGEVTFSPDIWKSTSRFDPDIP